MIFGCFGISMDLKLFPVWFLAIGFIDYHSSSSSSISIINILTVIHCFEFSQASVTVTTDS